MPVITPAKMNLYPVCSSRSEVLRIAFNLRTAGLSPNAYIMSD
jgi:hypothetical protein